MHEHSCFTLANPNLLQYQYSIFTTKAGLCPVLCGYEKLSLLPCHGLLASCVWYAGTSHWNFLLELLTAENLNDSHECGVFFQTWQLSWGVSRCVSKVARRGREVCKREANQRRWASKLWWCRWWPVTRQDCTCQSVCGQGRWVINQTSWKETSSLVVS